MIPIQYEVFKALQYSMSKEETRYYLNGIHVSAKDLTLQIQSTDGHRLMRVSCECSSEHHGLSEIISSETVKMIIKLFGKRDKIVADFENENIIVNNVDYYPMKLIDGTFPDADRVVPTNDSQKIPNGFGFNLGYVADFAKALRALGCKKPYAKMYFGEAKSNPLAVKYNHEGLKFLGVLMPLHLDQ